MILNVCKLANQWDAALRLFEGLLQNNHTFQTDIKSYRKVLNLCAKLKPLLLETAMEIIVTDREKSCESCDSVAWMEWC